MSNSPTPASRDAETGRIRRLNVDSLQELPATARNISANLVDKAYNSMTESGTPPPIQIGLVDGSLYIVNDFELVLGMKKAGVKRATACVTRYGSMRDLLAAHIRANYASDTIDPLLTRDVISLMVDDGRRKYPIYKELKLDRQPELLGAIRAKISDEARHILLRMSGIIARQSSSTAMPAYYMGHMAGISSDKQHGAALQLEMHTLSNAFSGTGPGWLNSTAVKIILDMYKKDPGEISVLDFANEYKKHIEAEGIKLPDGTILNRVFTPEIDPDLVCVPSDGKLPTLLFSKNTGRCGIMGDDDKLLYKLCDDNGHVKWVFSPTVYEFFDMANKPKLRMSTFSTITELVKTVKTCDKKTANSKCMVLIGPTQDPTSSDAGTPRAARHGDAPAAAARAASPAGVRGFN